VVKDKPWGSAVKASAMVEALKVYFHNGDRLRYDVVNAMIPKLKEIQSWFKAQQDFKFVGSSILYVYDGASGTQYHLVLYCWGYWQLHADDYLLETPKICVRLVDFAHTAYNKGAGLDNDYLVGLNNLVNYFEQVRRRQRAHAFNRLIWRNFVFVDICWRSDGAVEGDFGPGREFGG